MSELLLRGLDRRGERTCLAVCVAMVVLYLGVFAWLLHASIRFDQVFLARQEEVRLNQLAQHRMVLGQPVALTSLRLPAPELALLGGWWALEEDSIWSATASPAFALTLPTVHPPSLALDLKVIIMALGNDKQGVRLFANDQLAGEWQLPAGPARLCALLPEAVTGSIGTVRLRFQIAHPARPPGGKDRRELGLALQQITVVPGPCGAKPG